MTTGRIARPSGTSHVTRTGRQRRFHVGVWIIALALCAGWLLMPRVNVDDALEHRSALPAVPRPAVPLPAAEPIPEAAWDAGAMDDQVEHRPSSTIAESLTSRAVPVTDHTKFTPQRAEFEAIAEQLEGRADFFRRDRSADIRNQLARLDLPVDLQWSYQEQLALVLLQEGKTAEAARAADDLFRRLTFLPGVLDANVRLWRTRGLVYLRLSEVENCIQRHNAQCCLFPLVEGGVHANPTPAAEARRCYEAYLKQQPDDLGVRWLLNIVAMATGDYPAGVLPAQLIPPSALKSTYDVGRFPDIAGRLGVDTFNLCGGCIVDDLDGDNLLDIATSTIDPSGPIQCYRNLGDGTFEDTSASWRLNDQLGGLNIVPSDFDNDGDVDILVLRGAWMFEAGRVRNSLLRNDGHGRYVDVTRAAGIAEPTAPTQAAAWCDFDGDGDVDLYVANESRSDASMVPEAQRDGGDYPSQLFRNNGDGTFTDTAVFSGVTNDRYAKGVTTGDYDNDGDLDLYVSNFGKNRLYQNQGDGTFIDVAETLQVTEPSNRSFATWFFDYDNDGWLDLFVTAYDATIDDIAADYLGLPHEGTSPRLYRNLGGTPHLGFRDVTVEVGLNRPLLPMGANFGDLDNDGYLDIYLTTGDPSYESLMPNVMLRNDRGKRFQDVSESGGFGHLQKGHGVAFADLDQDGDQDIYHQLGGFYPGDAFRNALFHNPGHGNHFLTVRLVGTKSPRNGYGARVTVTVATPDGQRSIHRSVGSVSSFGGSPARQELGLGRADAIRELRIDWPVSRSSQVFLDVPLDAMVEVTEGTDALRTIRVAPIPF